MELVKGDTQGSLGQPKESESSSDDTTDENTEESREGKDSMDKSEFRFLENDNVFEVNEESCESNDEIT